MFRIFTHFRLGVRLAAFYEGLRAASSRWVVDPVFFSPSVACVVARTVRGATIYTVSKQWLRLRCRLLLSLDFDLYASTAIEAGW